MNINVEFFFCENLSGLREQTKRWFHLMNQSYKSVFDDYKDVFKDGKQSDVFRVISANMSTAEDGIVYQVTYEIY
jgi:hypothetical protein